MWEPMSRKSGHERNMNMINKTKKNVVSTRTLQRKKKISCFKNLMDYFFRFYLVFKNGIKIPAPVATNNKTT